MGKEYIGKWLELNDGEDFLRRIFVAIRDMHTVIKNEHVPNSVNTATFFPKLNEASKPPRFDRIEREAKYSEITKRS